MSKKVIRKAENGSGTLEKRGKVWFVRYMDVDGKRKRISTHETDKIDAQRFLDKFMGQRKLEGELGDKQSQLYHVKARLENEISAAKSQLMTLKKIPIGDMYKRLFESDEGKRYRPQNVCSQTSKQYERFSRKFIEWLKENHEEVTSVDLVSHEICGKFLDYILETGSGDLHRRVLTLLRFIFEKYVEMGYLFSNPFLGFHNQKNIKVIKRRILTDEEMLKLHEHLKTQDIETQAIFVFAEESGQRFGDCCCFRWEYFRDEIVDGRTVRILKYMPRKTQKYGTVVEMPLTRRMTEMLDELKKINGESEYVNPRWHDLYLQNNSCYANKQINQIIKDAGIKTTDENGKTNVGIHSLRHQWVSRLAFSDKNIPLMTIKSMVGHTREDMSEYYAESTVKNQLLAINALEDASKRSGTVILSHDLYERYLKLKGNKTDEELMTKMIELLEMKNEEEEKERQRVMKQIADLVDGIDSENGK